MHPCAGASPTFKNQELAVVGGGDSAAEEAIYLTKYAKHVSPVLLGIFKVCLSGSFVGSK